LRICMIHHQLQVVNASEGNIGLLDVDCSPSIDYI
jgi:hypothetical protein